MYAIMKKGKEILAWKPVVTQMESFDSFRSLLEILRSCREFKRILGIQDSTLYPLGFPYL
jgi:hypothetical protein